MGGNLESALLFGSGQNVCHLKYHLFQYIYYSTPFDIQIIEFKLFPESVIGNKSSLIQVMVWCQATQHTDYLNQIWPIYMAS